MVHVFQVKFMDPLLQEEREVRAGRMECTMQNLADSLTTRTSRPLAAAVADGNSDQLQQDSEQLSSFMVYNMRRKVNWGEVTSLVPWLLGCLSSLSLQLAVGRSSQLRTPDDLQQVCFSTNIVDILPSSIACVVYHSLAAWSVGTICLDGSRWLQQPLIIHE